MKRRPWPQTGHKYQQGDVHCPVGSWLRTWLDRVRRRELEVNYEYHMNMHVTEIHDDLLAVKAWPRPGGSLLVVVAFGHSRRLT